MARPGAAVLEAHAPGEAEARRPFPYPDRAARHWILSSIVWLTIVDLFGLVLATEFISPEALSRYSWLAFSRIRPAHVNVIILVWLANVANVLATVQIRTIRPIYVSVWFFIASPLWLVVDYTIGNVIWRPGHVIGAPSGALSNSLADAILNWWYAHNLFGLWLTPMLIALTYYIVPRITNTPLYSYTLSLISFWGMAFLYTGVGDHHILQSPTPSWLKTIAEVSSWMLLVPVFAFTINILGTMKGNWDRFFTNLPLRFTITAFFFYFLVNIQGAFEALQPCNRLTHFTNFVVAHAHLALLGAFTILGMGVIDYIV